MPQSRMHIRAGSEVVPRNGVRSTEPAPRDLDDFLEALPEEADRIGVDRATIPELHVVAVFKDHMIDERFAEQTDKRDLDEAITPTDLWWVVLGDAREAPRLPVGRPVVRSRGLWREH